MSLPPSSAPTATGWSDSCRAGFAPAEEWRLVTAHRKYTVTAERELPSRLWRPRRMSISRRAALRGLCQQQTHVLAEQFGSTEHDGFRVLQPFGLPHSVRTTQFLVRWVVSLLAIGGYKAEGEDSTDLGERIDEIFKLPLERRTPRGASAQPAAEHVAGALAVGRGRPVGAVVRRATGGGRGVRALAGDRRHLLRRSLLALLASGISGMATLPTPKAHDWRRRTIASACDRVSSNVRPAVSTTCAVFHGS